MGVETFPDFHKLVGSDNNMTFQENPSNPEGNRRGDDPNGWCCENWMEWLIVFHPMRVAKCLMER